LIVGVNKRVTTLMSVRAAGNITVPSADDINDVNVFYCARETNGNTPDVDHTVITSA
jgi:hypothetical protein